MQPALPLASVSHRLLPVQMECTFSSRIKDVSGLSLPVDFTHIRLSDMNCSFTELLDPLI